MRITQPQTVGQPVPPMPEQGLMRLLLQMAKSHLFGVRIPLSWQAGNEMQREEQERTMTVVAVLLYEECINKNLC